MLSIRNFVENVIWSFSMNKFAESHGNFLHDPDPLISPAPLLGLLLSSEFKSVFSVTRHK